jgi:ATP/maltotriose-dependent transcriptional regulator MalT
MPPAAKAAAIALDALGDSALLREQTSDSLAINLAIIALIFCGRNSEALQAVEDVLTDARRRGAALAFAEASMLRALVMYACGRIVEAEADAQAAIEGTERGWHAMGPIAQATLANCLIERGELDAADATLRAADAALAHPGTKGPNALFFVARGRLRLLRGDPAGALADFLAARDALEPYETTSPAHAQWRCMVGLAAHALGDDQRALRMIDEEIALARRFDLPVQLGIAIRARATVEGLPRALSTLDQAVELLQEAGAPLEHARALVDLGSAHRRAGHRVVCREPLRRALEIAHQCGAAALEQQAHDELLASGARPRRPVLSGVDALTPSERRIAELAADGHSNRRIAEMLFLTKNTVEWHLRHVYQKLDVASRESLRKRLDQERGSVAAA